MLYRTATSLIAFISFILIVLIIYKYKENLSIPMISALSILGLAIFLVGFLGIVQGKRTIGYFSCGNCNTQFIPSLMNYIITAHIFGKSYLRCPECGKNNWCKKRL